MSEIAKRLKTGIVTENPTFVQMLGMCPTLAVTTSAINGLGMGLATTAILICSNFVISLLRKVIPDKVRIPAYIVVIASFVTVVQFIMQAYVRSLYQSLGIFIPLIVVNCIILGRAESYASKNGPINSIFDGVGMGLGFTIGLTSIGIIRELIGAGTVFGARVIPADYTIPIFIFAPGAFFVLAMIIAVLNKRALVKAAKTGEKAELCKIADCASCQNASCAKAPKQETKEELADANSDKTEEGKED